MAGYSPLKITGNQTGLVQSREEFILPNDAYPVLQNAFVWRERIKRKKGTQFLGRLQRNIIGVNWFQTSASIWAFTIKTQTGFIINANNANPGQITTSYEHDLVNGDQVVISGIVGATGYNNTSFVVTVVDSKNFTVGVNAAGFGAYSTPSSLGKLYNGTFISNQNSVESNSSIVPGSVVFTITTGPIVFTDQGNGTLTSPTPGNSATINYISGELFITHTAGIGQPTTLTYSYYPGIPVMGILPEELSTSNQQLTIFFDQTYAYTYNFTTNLFSEWIPGTIWHGSDSNFFWAMNYWQTPSVALTPPGLSNSRLFWVTNFNATGATQDPIYYTEGTTWVPFAPQIDNATPTPNRLQQCLAMIPFRGRMVVFNTWEGTSLASAIPYPQRIRWANIGNPISDVSVLFPSGTEVVNAWNADVRGKGGFLNIPTTETIVSVGFVRDNLVIYCEHSTWQLRYTGRSIAPFQIERVNSELGAQSTFSAIRFDTSLVGIGDKGIVECDSYQSRRIDIKIPDLVFTFNNVQNNYDRVYGIRDFQQQLAYWTYPDYNSADVPPTYPNRRLVYNYENDSWAIFTDSFTCFGLVNQEPGLTWANANRTWAQANVPWNGQAPLDPIIAAGNQQGFIQILDQYTKNQQSLFIQNITGNTTTPTVITSPNHNLETGQVVQIVGIINNIFDTLNNGIYGIQYIDANNFSIFAYNPATGFFDSAVLNGPGAYPGGASLVVIDNFLIQSKKFNYLDEGQAFQLGFIDILMDQTSNGAITIYVYTDYNTADAVNVTPLNTNSVTQQADTFFNSIIPTSAANPKSSTKNWQRVYCQVRSAFVTLAYTLSGAQMNGPEQSSDVQIDAQILWTRKAGRNLPPGV